MIDILAFFQNNMTAIGVFVAVFVGFYILRTIFISRFAKLSAVTENDFDDLVVNLLRTIGWLFAVTLSFYIALAVAGVPFFTIPALSVIFIIVFTYQIVRAVGVVFDYSVKKFTEDEGAARSVHGLKTIVAIAIWASGILFVLSALGYNINSVIAGLGIGGLAVALALQSILGDVFSSFSILFDRPFTVGDFVAVGSQEGTVEKIGLKTTRLRTLRGEQVIISNQQLTSSEIQNFGRLERRRVTMLLGFEYETDAESLKSIPEHVKELVESFDDLAFEWMAFKEFGASALVFELVYYVNSDEYNTHLKTRHDLGLSLKGLFDELNVGLAYPTQRIYQTNLLPDKT